MRRPRIGLNCDLALDDRRRGEYAKLYASYFDAVERAGGMPVLLAPCAEAALLHEQVEMLDGLLLTGGNDYDPAWYGQERRPEVELVRPRRGEYDRRLADAAVESELPVLAVCGGAQLVNVVLGGSLVQDIASAPGHFLEHADGAMHCVELTGEGVLPEIVGSEPLETNSFHHQAVDALASGLVATATASDGIVEAFESTDERFLLCVQWHPERLLDRPRHLALFEALVWSAGG
jgi:putative glutamine amidotransferase